MTFARTSILTHKSTGAKIETPLLIPSFSSKGFRSPTTVVPLPEGELSPVTEILTIAGEAITESYLISAFDIFYKMLPAPTHLPFKPEIIVLDSGGYEISDSQDLSTVYSAPGATEPWNAKNLATVLDNWPEEIPVIMVSYDHPKERMPVEAQIKFARKFFRGRMKHLVSLLLKPETVDQQTLDKALSSILGNARELSGFDVIGVTEKELGSKVLDRMMNIARLRRALDEANIPAPIHVFGALDPLFVSLYFIAGAEIFDGLTWIRYAFDDGRCVYPHDFWAKKYGLYNSNDQNRARMLRDNIQYLNTFTHNLRMYASTGNFARLPNADFLRDAKERLDVKLTKKKGAS